MRDEYLPRTHGTRRSAREGAWPPIQTCKSRHDMMTHEGIHSSLVAPPQQSVLRSCCQERPKLPPRCRVTHLVEIGLHDSTNRAELKPCPLCRARPPRPRPLRRESRPRIMGELPELTDIWIIPELMFFGVKQEIPRT